MGRPPAPRSRATRAVGADLRRLHRSGGLRPRSSGAVNDGEAGPPGGTWRTCGVGLSGGTARPSRRRQPRASALFLHPSEGRSRGRQQRSPPQPMQRVRSNTRLGTLIVTTVPVTTLGVVVGMGLGAPLIACGPVALVLGVGLGALLAAGTRRRPSRRGGRVHTSACARCSPGPRTRRAPGSPAWTCASTSRRRGFAPWGTRSACTAR